MTNNEIKEAQKDLVYASRRLLNRMTLFEMLADCPAFQEVESEFNSLKTKLNKFITNPEEFVRQEEDEEEDQFAGEPQPNSMEGRY